MLCTPSDTRILDEKDHWFRVMEQSYRLGVAVRRAPSSHLVDFCSNPLSSHPKNLKKGIRRYPAWRSAIGIMWKMKYETEFNQS